MATSGGSVKSISAARAALALVMVMSAWPLRRASTTCSTRSSSTIRAGTPSRSRQLAADSTLIPPTSSLPGRRTSDVGLPA